MRNKKIIIRNCPCYEGEGAFYNCVNEHIDGDCQDCTDCVMKQIVEKCKKAQEYHESFIRIDDILDDLDIQEAE